MVWSRQDSEESIRLLINIANNKFSIGFNKTPKKDTSQQKGNQKLLYESIQSYNHSRLGEFVSSSPSDETIQTKSVPQE
jgi:hypothetical protein